MIIEFLATIELKSDTFVFSRRIRIKEIKTADLQTLLHSFKMWLRFYIYQKNWWFNRSHQDVLSIWTPSVQSRWGFTGVEESPAYAYVCENIPTFCSETLPLATIWTCSNEAWKREKSSARWRASPLSRLFTSTWALVNLLCRSDMSPEMIAMRSRMLPKISHKYDYYSSVQLYQTSGGETSPAEAGAWRPRRCEKPSSWSLRRSLSLLIPRIVSVYASFLTSS